MEKLSTSQPSPLSPTLWPADAFSARRCLIFIAVLFVALVLDVVFARLAVQIGAPAMRPGKALQLTAGVLIAQIVAYIPLLGAALPLLPFAAKRSLAQIGLHAPATRDLLIGVIGAFVMFVVANGAANLQKHIFHLEGTQTAVQLFETTHDRILIYGLIALAVVFAPFVEEVIFRGFVFNALLRYVPFSVAAAISGMIFGLAHADKTAFFPLACGGFVLAFVYYRTGSLFSSMLTHGTFNAVNVALVLATSGGKG